MLNSSSRMGASLFQGEAGDAKPRKRRARDSRLSESQPSADAACCLSTVTLHYAPGQCLALAYFGDAVTYGGAQTRAEMPAMVRRCAVFRSFDRSICALPTKRCEAAERCAIGALTSQCSTNSCWRLPTFRVAPRNA